MISIRPATVLDAALALSTSEWRDDLGAGDKLYVSMQVSAYVWAGRIDGEIVCLWGLIRPTVLSDSPYLWMVHTDALEAEKFLFIRHSQLVVRGLLEYFPRIVGHAEPRSQRWLKWLGAEFGYPQGRLIPFEIRAR